MVGRARSRNRTDDKSDLNSINPFPEFGAKGSRFSLLNPLPTPIYCTKHHSPSRGRYGSEKSSDG